MFDICRITFAQLSSFCFVLKVTRTVRNNKLHFTLGCSIFLLKNKWTDIDVFYSIIVTTEFEVRIQTAQGMLDVVSHSEVLIKKSVELV